MRKFRPWYWGILLLSFGCSGTGAWLCYRGAQHLNRSGFEFGVLLLFAGATLVPASLGLIVNYWVPGERQALALSQSRKRTQLDIKIHKLEKGIRSVYYMKRHPLVVFVFLLGALILLCGMAMAPVWGPHDQTVVAGQVLGIIFGLAYFVMIVLFLYAVRTKRWEPYMDRAIQKTEAQIAQLKLQRESDRKLK